MSENVGNFGQAQVPNVYWHPTLGLLRERDGVWWRQHEGFMSLRHDGLPNERPADAVKLTPVVEPKSRYDFDQPVGLTAAQPGQVPASNPEPCRRGVVAGQVVTRPCPSCGHVQLLHPGPHNPALRACLVCQVRDALTALTEETPT